MIENSASEGGVSALRAFLESAPDPVLVAGADGRILHLNRLLQVLLGYTEAELVGQAVELLVPEAVRARHVASRERYVAAPRPRPMGRGVELSARRKDGSQIPVEIGLGAVRFGGEQVVCCVVRDLRERRRAELERIRAVAALTESEARARDLADLSSDWYWEQDENFRFVDTASTPTGLSPLRAADYVGKTRWEIDDGTVSPEQWAAHRRQLEAREIFRDFEYKRVSRDGQVRWASVSGRPIFDRDGRFRGYRGIGRDITSRKRVEIALRESEERFRALTELSSDFYWEQDEQFRFVERVGSAWEKHAYPAESTIGKARWELPARNLTEADWQRHRADLEAHREFRNFEIERPLPSGGARWISTSGRPIFDGAGRFRGYRGVGQDITARKLAEQKMREREAQLNLVVDNVPAMICYFDSEYRYRYANRSYIQFYAGGRSLEGKTLREGLGDRVWEIARPSIDRALAGEAATYSRTDRREGGAQRQVEVTLIPHRDAGGRVLGVHTMVLDVTERRRAEEALRLRNRAIESSVNSVMLTEPGAQGQRIVYVNPAFERITGYTEAEVLGQSPRLLYREDRDQPGVEALRTAFRERGEATALIRNYRKDGSMFWNEVRVAPVPDETGRVTHFVNIANDVTDRVRYESEIERNANYDALTGLPNRNLLNDRLAQAIVQAARAGETLAVMFVDLDHLKRINDTVGHQVGDQVIVAAGRRIAEALRVGDTVARLGGDEFVILLANLKRADDAKLVAAKVLDSIGEPLKIGPHEFVISASVGIALHPKDGIEAETLLRNADSALFRAKEEGRNGFRFFAPEMNDRVVRFLAVERELRSALETGQFSLQYQPIVDLDGGQTVGVEALIRWRRADGSVESPAEFIPIAEESGLIVPIGRWVIEAAARQAAEWNRGGRESLYVSVNLSARQFRDPGLLDSIRHAIRDAGVAPALMKFEITESTVMRDPEKAVVLLQALKDIGVDLSVDDFGTGYSSLAYLKRFPIDVLKLDRSFVRDLPGNADDLALSCAVIDLARALDLKVVAEGIETLEQAEILAAKGCRFGQGFYFGRPSDPAALDNGRRRVA